jgi:Family of unknown function (DUF5682)
VTDGVAVLGVRHHGPGSSRSVLRVLERLEPDLVLVEGPPDAQSQIRLAAAPGMRPPVALVIYPVEHPGVAVFYPFATFSPEWNALRYALAREIPVRFCDLPQAVSLADVLSQHPEREAEENGDPIQMLAQAAGEPDPERWWERLVEQRIEDADVFRAVTEAMAAVRETLPDPPAREARREAAMRQAIRRGRSEGFDRIAVICGAWHAPALDTLPLRKTDETLLRGLRRIKVEATWVPWTASRLAYKSGYGAGVESPAWYRHLWETSGDLTTWLASAARLLRDEDMDASPAQVVDAVRLAHALAALRDRPQPSLSEATEATLAVLCGGESARMTLIRSRLVVGVEMGGLPEGVPAVPLQRDLEAQARRLRLRTVAEQRMLDLDLRLPHQLEQSKFLHRLRILGIDWGRLQPLPRGKLGTFHELWILHWQPESVLQVVEAGVYGNTVVDAASARAIERGEMPTSDLSQIASLIELVLLADLEAAVPRLVALLGNRSAESTDVLQMLQALPPLASTVRYGDVRRTDTAALAKVVRAIAERVTAGLGPACVGLDDEAAGTVASAIVSATQAIGVVLSDQPNASLVEDWWAALLKVLDRRDLASLIAGTCTRLLLNAERIRIDEAADRLGRGLARGTDPADVARWIEGFVRPSPQRGGSGLVLATAGPLFGLIDRWLTSLPAEYFAQVLPLLRRTTSTFSSGERHQIAERVQSGGPSLLLRGGDDLDAERAALVEPIVLAILGVADVGREASPRGREGSCRDR